MLEDAQIQALVEKVMREVGEPTAQPIAPDRPTRPPLKRFETLREAPPGEVSNGGQDGVFPTLDQAVAAATVAFQQLNALPLTIRNDMVAHMRQAGRENATLLAEMAVEETGMGRVEDKTLKTFASVLITFGGFIASFRKDSERLHCHCSEFVIADTLFCPSR